MLPSAIIQQALAHGQEHLVELVKVLPPKRHESYCTQIAQLNFAELKQLFEQSRLNEAQLDLKHSKSPQIVRLPNSATEMAETLQAKARGEQAIREGKVAIIMVAGGFNLVDRETGARLVF